MRRLAVITALLLLSFAALAGTPWFCGTQGTRLSYVRRYAESGKVRWRYTMSLDKVEAGSGGTVVDFTCDFRKPGGAQMYRGPVSSTVRIAPNGDVTLNTAESMYSVFRNIFPKADITSEGGETALPSELREGDLLPDVFSLVKVHGMRYVTKITDRKVLRMESVVTPAGSFDCVVISEHKTESGPGRNRDVLTHTWYARGTGMVRHDTFDRKTKKLLTSEVLEMIE